MTRIIATAAAALALTAGAATAEEHVVRMLNQGPDGGRMVFEPAVVHAEPGDTVRFVPEARGHNAQTEVAPEGEDDFRGRLNEEVTYEIDETGLTLVKCTPHYPLGMIAVIVSGGDFSNEDAVRDAPLPGQAGRRIEAYLEEAKAEYAG